MFKKLLNKKLLKNQKGLTLIELLAVIVILAIIAAIAIPAIGNIISNSKDKAILSDAAGVLAGAKIAIADGACGEPSSAGIVTCDKKVLEDVFEDKEKLSDGDQVTYEKSKSEYKITYGKLANIKNETKFTTKNYAAKNTTISNKDLNEVMSK
ncbi:prepilin-type N-terminal cleavage/methylation domain-containing protein [Lysinibacillus sp. Ag94]|uniref:prepilin-type N-terminal cleavage/methylation domain-containing protein n=1 Tax=Lysinibacillus sp. Ag94 TaxID=2936682 RepID=UPI00200D3CC2|nr:prepilin-type N-terminal cleavage/methylation domain-containing protein [Lysinibacillus sp. Ag94]UPW84310.1 prepilin-type N-terminal cleavage/methylation domain-containing protein [Lysinibacillus sp. Ag94]